MKSSFDRRTILSALALPTLLAFNPASPPGDDDVLSGEIHVGPAPDSDLDWDSSAVIAVRNLLAPLTEQKPSCPAGAVEKLLEAKYRRVVEEELAPDYRWVIFQGDWTHICFHHTNFTIDLGRGDTILVQVIEKELKD